MASSSPTSPVPPVIATCLDPDIPSCWSLLPSGTNRGAATRHQISQCERGRFLRQLIELSITLHRPAIPAGRSAGSTRRRTARVASLAAVVDPSSPHRTGRIAATVRPVRTPRGASRFGLVEGQDGHGSAVRASLVFLTRKQTCKTLRRSAGDSVRFSGRPEDQNTAGATFMPTHPTAPSRLSGLACQILR